jgi:para-nitrobenzyl esterase
MLGATAQETPPMPPALRARFAEARAQFLAPGEDVRLLPAYGSQEALDSHLASDLGFAAMMRSLGQLHLGHGYPAYRYRFAPLPDAAAPMLKGLPHGGDKPYVFGTLDFARWKMTARDRAVSDAAMDYWVEFARSGRPAPAGRAAWPDASGDRIMRFDNEGARPLVDDRAVRYQALADIIDPRS